MIDKLLPTMDILEFFDYVYKNYERYWHRANIDSTRPEDFAPHWSILLSALAKRKRGLALDLGAGEGAEAIRLARMGYEVDAVEASAVGAEKIEMFARQAHVHVNVLHEDVRIFQPIQQYDVIICNGLLNYIEDKASILKKMQLHTRVEGYNLVSVFTNYTPVPECHQVIDVYCDQEEGAVTSLYHEWHHLDFLLERNKLDISHPGFPSHHHSMLKILAQKPRDSS
jgi:2-polyprenyl-3-methyl-5-hydroxy-6-metoxy-1,4-benzoquinol methylase